MTLRDSLLPAVDVIRGIPALLGLRQFTVTVTVRTWSGARVGLGTKTDVVSTLTVNKGGSPVRVRQVSRSEVIASGGLYTDRDIKIGACTPPYSSYGTSISVIDPPTASASEIFWHVTGLGLPSAGVWCDKINTYADKNFSWYLVLRATGRKP